MSLNAKWLGMRGVLNETSARGYVPVGDDGASPPSKGLSRFRKSIDSVNRTLEHDKIMASTKETQM